MSRPYLLRTFFLIHPRFGAKDGLCCRKMPPGWVWKTTSNAFDKPCAEASLFMFCHGEKECHEMEQLRQDNQQETCSRRSVVTCCFPCSSPWSAWASKRQYPGEALLLVVKVVQVVFIYILGISSQGKGKTICGFMGFPLAAWVGNRTFAAENE